MFPSPLLPHKAKIMLGRSMLSPTNVERCFFRAHIYVAAGSETGHQCAINAQANTHSVITIVF